MNTKHHYLEEVKKLDRAFALKLNKYIEELDGIFNHCCRTEQGLGTIGI